MPLAIFPYRRPRSTRRLREHVVWPVSRWPSSALRPCLRPSGARSRLHRRVQCHGSANERLERLFIDLVALVEIDGASGVAFEAGVEEARRVRQRSALGEGHLHDTLVRLARADDSGVRPDRNSRRTGGLSPFHLLDRFGIGLLDKGSDASERFAPPITLRGSVWYFSFL